MPIIRQNATLCCPMKTMNVAFCGILVKIRGLYDVSTPCGPSCCRILRQRWHFAPKNPAMGIFPAKSPTMGKLPCRQPGDGQSSPPSRDDGQPSLPSARRWANFPAMQKAPVCSRSRGFLLVCSAHPNRLGLGASGDTLDGMPTGRLQPHAAEVRTTPSSRERSQEPPDQPPWKTSQAPRSSA